MENLLPLVVAGVLVGFCLLAKWVSTTVVTAPMIALSFGALLGAQGLIPEGVTQDHLHGLAEIALVVLLFLDAARIDIPALLGRHTWPLRTLFLGMPLAFGLGTLMLALIFPGWPLAVTALMAAILVPTDAALGQPVIDNTDVPARHRRAITIESGLNDGIALPAIVILAAIAAPSSEAPAMGWTLFALAQITLGPLTGIALGLLGGHLFLRAQDVDLTADTYEGIAALALATAAYFAAQSIGGNGFIAAFSAGIGFGYIARDRCKFVYEFTESEGQALSWAAFFLIGALLVPQAAAGLTLPMFGAIALSLLLVRPLAVWLSLIGTDANGPSRLFLGWFGPRGLATALFALIVTEEMAPDTAEFILTMAVNAVWISALIHGVTAVPAARRFAALSGPSDPKDP
ncbi:cation:proton antiporter [Alphaproteobacteria bacterium KMM 3653]|uniref:Cation:proton antiporter n=1 Tax=Harenicola maris TaxID=2841044 RepID=A0AAP2CRE1_9RHOB|nr:cation:proton antiporter [Harenicola maris]